MGYVTSSIRERVANLVKTAAEEGSKYCTDCDKPGPECKCKKGMNNSKESMGTGGSYDSGGMDVTASASLIDQLEKAASALDYCALNIHEILDDRSAEEKIAELAAYSAEYQKLAENAGSFSGQLDNTLNDDALTRKEQPTPSTGSKVAPRVKNESHIATLPNDYNVDRTDEEWTEDPQKGKKASVMRYKLRKLANPMAGGAPAPQPAPQPAPAAVPAMGMPPGAPAPGMPMAAPAPPPGPDPMMIAQQLQAQGQLTPEALAQAAGISPEEAAAIIASLSGGTGAPAPQPAPAMAAPPPGAEPGGAPAPGGGAAGGGGPGMEVQASAESLFQSALRKYASNGDGGPVPNISSGKTDEHPADEDVKHRPMPGREGIQSNESAIAFTAQAGQKPRDNAVSSLLSASVPYKRESGAGAGGGNAMDSMTTNKTSSAKLSRVRGRLKAAMGASPSV